MIVLCAALVMPVSALEIEAPAVPERGREWMPDRWDSFQEGLWDLVGNALSSLRPDLREAARTGVAVTAAVLLTAIVQTFSIPVKTAVNLAGTAAITALLLTGTQSMIALGAQTVANISDYGKLLLPVMATALAAQGGITSATGLYAATALFDSLLITAIKKGILPGIWLYLALSAASIASGEDLLKKLADLLKSLLSWFLRILLMVFTTYLSITGVVSGTTDAVALKAARVSISTFVPVVGGILSDASEAVLISAGVMKNAAGIYGILAVLAVFLHPFLEIGSHYLILRLTAAICGVFGGKAHSDLIERFSSAMGLLLGLTGSCCIMALVSTVCFMKGVI